VVKILSSRTKRFPKILFTLSRCRIPKVKGSGDLLSCSPVHAGAQDGEGYGGGIAARRNKILVGFDVFLVEAVGSYIHESEPPSLYSTSKVGLNLHHILLHTWAFEIY
jgi:hypothetical protein